MSWWEDRKKRGTASVARDGATPPMCIALTCFAMCGEHLLVQYPMTDDGLRQDMAKQDWVISLVSMDHIANPFGTLLCATCAKKHHSPAVLEKTRELRAKGPS